MINVTKNHLRETPGHLLENMANWETTWQEKKEEHPSSLHLHVHIVEKIRLICVGIRTFFTVSNMNLQATKSYNFHIIKIVFHQLSDSSQCIVPIGSS